MIRSLLIANRGEIACRIIRTARAMGIRTVAVYSDADAKALHVEQADEAAHIGPSPARDSYLVGEKIIAAAQATRAEAIHPGYGFLSENAEFAQAVIDAGLVWVGPKPSSITAMGLKDAAKKLMADAGVPVTPGYMGDNQEPAFLAGQAETIGYPVLIKAVAGGGGKGMRRVDNPADVADALASCQREAAASFGNDHVLIEKYILCPRHIEVQVFGDSHGNIVHLFERDCSLQRRHQKVIEEAPAPGMDEQVRAELCAAAVRAAQAVDYVGAGTVEFIADASDGLRADRIWFMEMNTRLQVEHPVTEAITGTDLVEWQLRVASGEPLPLGQDELGIDGWAMEARLYAEDPTRGFLPSIGRLDLFHAEEGSGGRIDTGVYQGAEVSPYYDPMIAKLIAHGTSREDARERLSDMIEHSAVWPVKSNTAFLLAALAHPQFAAGNVDTGLIDRDYAMLISERAPSDQALAETAAALVPQSLASGFRLNAPRRRRAWFLLDGTPVEIEIGDHSATANGNAATLVREAGQVWELSEWRYDGEQGIAASSGEIVAPMPGVVSSVAVAAGDRVKAGQGLLVLEAMKMENALRAPFDGVVAELHVAANARVPVDMILVRIEPHEEA